MINGYNNLDVVLLYVVVFVIVIIILKCMRRSGREDEFHCITQYGSSSRDNLQSLESASYKDATDTIVSMQL